MAEETPQNRERFQPLERRELRGLTLGDVFKWGGLILVGALSYAKTSNRVEVNTKRIEEVERKFEAIEKKYEGLQNYKEANELWKARMEEKWNYFFNGNSKK